MATAADAQSSGRYLTWANRPASTTPADVQTAQSRAPHDFIPRRVAPSQGQPRPMMQGSMSPVPVSQGLTPASAWLGPRVAPAYAPSAPNPVAYAATEMAGPMMMPAPEPVPTSPMPVLRSAPAPVSAPMAPRFEAPAPSMPQPMRSAPAPQPALPVASPAPAPTAAPPADPMAPRRDARIFQIQQPSQGQVQPTDPAVSAPAPTAAPAQASGQSGQTGSRYYSVHREAGRTPDRTALPEAVYFDSVSLDLAEPPEVELPVRDAQGRRRVAANVDPSLP